MDILIIGGSVFLGRHLVMAARQRGHAITLFNRGQHNPELFTDVQKLRGDRTSESDLGVLSGRRWDAVIDTCGYVPRVVRLSAEKLVASVERYCFISSVSVYGNMNTPDQDETAPVGSIAEPSTEEITGETYGPLKALCDQAVHDVFHGRALIIRPGLIVGPDDPSDRFTYWPHRIARGGDVLVPDAPAAPVQIIDVRDLAEWTIRLLDDGKTGIYNAVGPEKPLRLAEILETCKAVSGSDARFVPAPEAFLDEHGVKSWMDLPLWVASSAAADGLNRMSNRKAVGDGLTFRPLAGIIRPRDTLAWDRTRPAGRQWRAGLAPEKEEAVLAAWREKQDR